MAENMPVEAQRIAIGDLQPNQWITGIYVVNNCQLGQTRSGKPYLKCMISDRTGRTPGRMWNASEEIFARLPTDGFVWLEGNTQPYQGEMQVIIQNIAEAEPSPEDLANLLPRSEHDCDEMFAELRGILDSIKHTPLKVLTAAYLADEPLMARFCQAPAASSLHHAYLGGLLEHTLQLMRLADALLPHYPELNRDVVMMGLFLHDLGKCCELTWSSGFGYSDDGNLVGHIGRGVIWLERKARTCAEAGQKIPEPLLRVLHHIILSHHGRPEFGALKTPATPEAIFISLVDNLDAKTHMALAATRRRTGPEIESGNFTDKVWALETRLFRPDPTTLADEPES